MNLREFKIGNLVRDAQNKRICICTAEILHEAENGIDFYDHVLINDDVMHLFGWGREVNNQDEYINNVHADYVFIFYMNTKCLEIQKGNGTILIERVEYAHRLQNIVESLTGHRMEPTRRRIGTPN